MYPHHFQQGMNASGAVYQSHPPHPPDLTNQTALSYHPLAHQSSSSLAYPPTVSSHSQAAGALISNGHSAYVKQQPSHAPPEPLPSASDVPETLGMTLPQIAEFASTMVYLMWHARRQSVMELHLAATTGSLPKNDDPNQNQITASIANSTSHTFKKFSRQILHSTQLSESVVMLSLKYIAMLLLRNPHIQGAEGSEYRLFIVALMLANKFLDDNTFTNKTWADVSGMAVTDLNIMELEFLDVLQFRLFVRKQEFDRWKIAVVNFNNQLKNANQAQEKQQQKMIETSLKGMGLSMLPSDQQWAIQQETSRQQTTQQQQQQKQYQQHQQFLYLLSKGQQPQIPTHLPSQPLARVPLRIPPQPVYLNIQTQKARPTPNGNPYERPMTRPSVQQQQQSYQGDGSGTSKKAFIHNDSQIISQYPQHGHQVPGGQATSNSKPLNRTAYDKYIGNSQLARVDLNDQTNVYHTQMQPGFSVTSQQRAAHAGLVPSYTTPYSQSAQHTTVHSITPRKQSIQNQMEYTTAPIISTPQPPQSSAVFYYATPSATPTTVPADSSGTSVSYTYGAGTTPVRSGRSFYVESKSVPALPPQVASTEYTSYSDGQLVPPTSMMRTSSHANFQDTDLYSQRTTSGYNPIKTFQSHRPSPAVVSSQEVLDRPIPENPYTAAESYRTHRQ